MKLWKQMTGQETAPLWMEVFGTLIVMVVLPFLFTMWAVAVIATH